MDRVATSGRSGADVHSPCPFPVGLGGIRAGAQTGESAFWRATRSVPKNSVTPHWHDGHMSDGFDELTAGLSELATAQRDAVIAMLSDLIDEDLHRVAEVVRQVQAEGAVAGGDHDAIIRPFIHI